MKVAAIQKKCARALVVVSLIEKLTADRKKLYEEHDELVRELEPAIGVGTPTNGIVLRSPFSAGNTQWGHGPVRRLVIEAAGDAAPAVAKKSRRVE